MLRLDMSNHLTAQKEYSFLAIKWLECNYKKLNQDKCQLLMLGHRYESMCENIGSHKIWRNNDPKRFGVKIDRNLKFSQNISKKCKKAGGKLSALIRNCKFMSVKRGRLLIKNFI